jgi:hypothetical protein
MTASRYVKTLTHFGTSKIGQIVSGRASYSRCLLGSHLGGKPAILRCPLFFAVALGNAAILPRLHDDRVLPNLFQFISCPGSPEPCRDTNFRAEEKILPTSLAIRHRQRVGQSHLLSVRGTPPPVARIPACGTCCIQTSLNTACEIVTLDYGVMLRRNVMAYRKVFETQLQQKESLRPQLALVTFRTRSWTQRHFCTVSNGLTTRVPCTPQYDLLSAVTVTPIQGHTVSVAVPRPVPAGMRSGDSGSRRLAAIRFMQTKAKRHLRCHASVLCSQSI